jgi:hypothetical protein
MSQTADLVVSVKDAQSTVVKENILTDELKAKLKAAVEEFILAPDDYIDVRRLPVTVKTLADLINYLKSIKDKLSKRDNKVKTEDWEVAKSGELKLYKLYVCGLNAVHSYLTGKPTWDVEVSKFSSDVITAAPSNKPPGLSAAGQTLWTKTFEGSPPRTTAVVNSIIFFLMLEARNTPTAPIVPPTPPEVQGVKKGAGIIGDATKDKVDEYASA